MKKQDKPLKQLNSKSNTVSVEKNKMITKELENKLIELWQFRATTLALKEGTKKYYDAQADWFCGAISGIDALLDNKHSCVTPKIWVSLLRGETITKTN